MTIVVLIVVAIIALAIGYGVSQAVQKSAQRKTHATAQSVLDSAKQRADQITKQAQFEAKDHILKARQDMDAEKKEALRSNKETENRLNQREKSLDHRSDALDSREHQLSSMQGQVERREHDVRKNEEQIAKRTQELERKHGEIDKKLEEVSGMTSDEAKTQLLDRLKSQVTNESASIIRESEQRTKAEADKKAREILSIAIQRVAADQSSDMTVSTIHIPSDDMKGRIIGREGRNIRSFEKLTGTNLIIDDTPEAVTISCFDPVRRAIGVTTMQNLIADGRIHPARIEEMYKKAKNTVDRRVQQAGEKAAFDAGVHDLHPELVKMLGRLLYRTSYGQNVLDHSLEVAYLASVMASELGLDPTPVKRAGLLHDIGKAIDHEVEGSHAVIGADLARRYGERPAIVHAIEAHHNDVEPNSVMDVLVQAADAVSAARPGARKETLDAYVKRLEKLEEIANSHEGVAQTYAIQAGREVRVMVEPDKVNEAQATVLAHDIASEIEEKMQYPGEVKVVVIRESRAIDVAK